MTDLTDYVPQKPTRKKKPGKPVISFRMDAKQIKKVNDLTAEFKISRAALFHALVSKEHDELFES